MDRRQYFRHFMIILTGSSAAQAMNLLSYPLLTRLYTPQAFGAFATFVAASAIPSSLACARFDIAVQTAPKWGRFGILWLCVTIAAAAGILTGIGAWIWWLLRGGELEAALPFLIGLTVFLTGLCMALSTYLLRHDQYRLVSTSVFVRTGAAVLLQIALALAARTSFSLILGFVLGLAGQAILLALSIWSKLRPGPPRLRDMRAMFFRFRRQVSLDVPSALLTSLNLNLLTILLGSLYGTRIVGFYSVGYRMAAMPLQLFNDALSQTFFQKAARAVELKGHFWDEMKFSFITSGLLSLAVLAGIVLLAKPFVILYLGPSWEPAATMLIILAPMMAMASVTQSSATAVFVLRKTHWRLVHTVVLVLLHLVLFAAARALHWSVITYLIAVAASFFVAWAGYAVLLLWASRGRFVATVSAAEEARALQALER